MADSRLDTNANRPPDEELLELADTLGLGLFSIDMSGRIVWANDAMARQYGYASTADAIGSLASDHYVDPKERQELFAQFLADPKVMEQGYIRFES